jgi:hypothetical protein
MSVLRSLEHEKDISVDLVVKAIEDALLIAYQRQEGTAHTARVELDRNSGHVTVWAEEHDEQGTTVGEYDATPTGFGRIATSTAKQVILQRLRDAEDELTFGEYAGREGDVVAGVIQQGKDPRSVLVHHGALHAAGTTSMVDSVYSRTMQKAAQLAGGEVDVRAVGPGHGLAAEHCPAGRGDAAPPRSPRAAGHCRRRRSRAQPCRLALLRARPARLPLIVTLRALHNSMATPG